MKLIEETLTGFIEQVDSVRPAPGGGSVSALASSLGVSLARMVGHLTISKKSFAKLDAFTQSQFNLKMEALLKERMSLLSLIDEDTNAFNQMMSSFRLPKENQEEVTLRDRAIEEATIHGIEVPKEVCKHSLACMRELSFFVANGNKSAISDIGVGALMLASGIEGAVLNMKINLPGLKNELIKKNYLIEISDIMNEMNILKKSVLNQVHSYLDSSVI